MRSQTLSFSRSFSFFQTIVLIASVVFASSTVCAQTSGDGVLAKSTTTQQQAHSVAISLKESFVSAAEIITNENVSFTPASVNIDAITKALRASDKVQKNKTTARFDLIVYVDNNGKVTNVNFITERPEDNAIGELISVACETVRASRFKPAELNHKTISSTVRIPFSIVL